MTTPRRQCRLCRSHYKERFSPLPMRPLTTKAHLKLIGTMNKFGVIVPAFSLLLALVSCNKETTSVPASQTSDRILTAVSEDSPITRTALSSNYAIKWLSTDQIKAYGSDDAAYTSSSVSLSEGGSKADFTFSDVPSGTSFKYAFYPAGAVQSTALSSDPTIYTTSAGLPASQKAVSGGFADGANLAIADASGEELRFLNVGTLLGVSFSSSKTISSITITTPEKTLTGAAYFDVSDASGFFSALHEKPGNSPSVTLTDVSATSGTYYAVVWPGSYSGIEVTFTSTDGNTATYSSSSAFTLERNGAYLVRDFTIADGDWIKTYSHTFASGDFGISTSAETITSPYTINGADWSLSYKCVASPYYFMRSYALQVGLAWNASYGGAESMTLSTSSFGSVYSVTVSTWRWKPDSGDDTCTTSLGVTVGGTALGTEVSDISNNGEAAHEYTFSSDEPLSGDLVITWTSPNTATTYYVSGLSVVYK